MPQVSSWTLPSKRAFHDHAISTERGLSHYSLPHHLIALTTFIYLIRLSSIWSNENGIILYSSPFLTLTPNLSASHLCLQNVFRKWTLTFISTVITPSSYQHHYFRPLQYISNWRTYFYIHPHILNFFHDSHNDLFKKLKSYSSCTYLKFSSGFPNSEGDSNSLPWPVRPTTSLISPSTFPPPSDQPFFCWPSSCSPRAFTYFLCLNTCPPGLHMMVCSHHSNLISNATCLDRSPSWPLSMICHFPSFYYFLFSPQHWSLSEIILFFYFLTCKFSISPTNVLDLWQQRLFFVLFVEVSSVLRVESIKIVDS